MPFILGQADTISGHADPHRQATCGLALGNTGRGVINLDHRLGRVDGEIGKTAIHHHRPRPAFGEVITADHVIGAIAMTGSDGDHSLHHLTAITGGGTDFQPALTQGGHSLDSAGDRVGVIGRNLKIKGQKGGIECGDIIITRFMPGYPDIGIPDARHLQHGGNVIAFGQPHRASRLGIGYINADGLKKAGENGGWCQ